jgi:octaprenyl-diphosphate synthase
MADLTLNTQRPAVIATDKHGRAEAARFLGLIADKLAATDDLFRRHLESDVPFINEAGEYIFNGGGKRMRPALLLLSARLLGRDGEEEITYAAVVELIHTATLLHDDIIDDSELRRGKTPVNRIWGNSRSVLLGDWLYTTSMQMALSHGRLEVIRRLCSATLKMTEGELLVLQRLGATDVSVDEYFDIIERKTAHLFAAACSIPALIPPSDENQVRTLESYGHNLGICFQLVDDLLDFTASESVLGKPVLSDLRGGKLTLPLILLLPRLGARERRSIEWVLEDRGFERTSPEEILEMVASGGTVDEVREMAAGYASAAREVLDALPPCESRDALEFAPEFVLDRRS